MKDAQGRIQLTNLTVSQPINLTVSPEVGPHPNTNSNTNRRKSDRVPSNAGHPLDPPLMHGELSTRNKLLSHIPDTSLDILSLQIILIAEGG